MRAALASVRQRFGELDHGVDTSVRSRLPWAPIVWALVLLSAAAVTWDSSWRLRSHVDRTLSWSGAQVLDGEWWRAVTAIVLTRDVFMLGSLLVSTSLLLWVVARLAGSWTALTVWVAGAVWGYLGTTLFLSAAGHLGWGLARATLATSDYGPSGGTAALAAAVVVLMRHRLVTLGIVAALLVGSALHHQVADVEHLVSFVTVLAVGHVVLRSRIRR